MSAPSASAAGYANPSALVESAWLADHLNDPAVAIVEVDVDTAAYGAGHIPGAIGWNWQTDLQQQPTRDLPSRTQWEALLSRSGIAPRTRVILYGDNHNWFAAYAYWLFRLYGHREVHLLNGGRARWIDEGRPVTVEQPRRQPTAYAAQDPDWRIRALRDDVRAALGGPPVLIDVRSPAEFSGELLAPAHLPQEGAQRGGHIAGAQNVPWSPAVGEDGRFKPAADLQAIYGAKGIATDRPAITYGRIGERSAHTWFVLTELLGVPDVRNYDGSWTEWGSLIGAPIET
ncbi:MAG: sulfurtransferase, partial [Chloroflexota bacterium]